ncbi:MAG TPA: hypothetical protein V6D12_16345, partial [Candidatus Obscuribacterales bacterium]
VQVLIAIADKLPEMPEVELFPPWKDTLHFLSFRTRPEVLKDVVALQPVIVALGGEAALGELFHAIQDVTKWWR